MWSFKKSPRPEELSTLTRTASFRCVLKPMANRSALVLGRSFGGHVYVISPPSRPKMYVVPAERAKTREKEDVKTAECQHKHYYNSKAGMDAVCVQSTVSLECYIVLSNDFAELWATYHSWTALSSVWGFKYTHVNSWVWENSTEIREAGTASLIMLHNYSVLLLLPASHPEGRDTSEFAVKSPWCPGTQHGRGAPPHLSRFISSLKGRSSKQHYWLPGPIMSFLWPPSQLFPVSLHYPVVSWSCMKGLNMTWWMEEWF